MAVAIRPARGVRDLDAIRELFREYADWLGIDLSFQGFEAELARLPGQYAAPGGELFLAEREDGCPVGCVGLRPMNASGACEMKRLYVREAVRGGGAGRALAAAAVAFAASAGYREVLLDTLPSMAAAGATYRALGFEPIPPYYDTPVAGTLFFRRALGPAGP